MGFACLHAVTEMSTQFGHCHSLLQHVELLKKNRDMRKDEGGKRGELGTHGRVVEGVHQVNQPGELPTASQYPAMTQL